jgi:hypothetical protein
VHGLSWPEAMQRTHGTDRHEAVVSTMRGRDAGGGRLPGGDGGRRRGSGRGGGDSGRSRGGLVGDSLSSRSSSLRRLLRRCSRTAMMADGYRRFWAEKKVSLDAGGSWVCSGGGREA